MAIRLATEGDVRTIIDRLSESDFSADVQFIRREILRGEEQTVMIDDVTGAVCRIEGTPDARIFAMVWLLPGTMSRAGLRLASATLNVVWRKYPRRRRWTFTGIFERGKDAQGQLDRGERTTLSWESFLNADGPVVTRRFDSRRNLWVLSSTLGALRDRLLVVSA